MHIFYAKKIFLKMKNWPSSIEYLSIHSNSGMRLGIDTLMDRMGLRHLKEYPSFVKWSKTLGSA
jgi:hypothetical protein